MRRRRDRTFSIELDQARVSIDDDFFVVFQLTNEIIEKADAKIDDVKGSLAEIGCKGNERDSMLAPECHPIDSTHQTRSEFH